MRVKALCQSAIREVHKCAFLRPMPEKVAIYLHEIHKDEFSNFEEFVRYWKDQDYAFVNARDYVAAQGRRVLYLSFDDNFRSWLDTLPLFDELDVKATFFINTSPIRDRVSQDEIDVFFERIAYENGAARTQTLSASEICEIANRGHTIGCHSHSHHNLSELTDEQARSEILQCKTILEEILGGEVRDFAYPYGMRRHFNEALREYCTEIGLTTVSNGIPGMLHDTVRPDSIHRSPWRFDRPIHYNVQNLKIDSRFMERLTGRTAAV